MPTFFLPTRMRSGPREYGSVDNQQHAAEQTGQPVSMALSSFEHSLLTLAVVWWTPWWPERAREQHRTPRQLPGNGARAEELLGSSSRITVLRKTFICGNPLKGSPSLPIFEKTQRVHEPFSVMVKRFCQQAWNIELYRQGFTVRDVHHRVGVHRSVIYRSIRRFEDLGTKDDRFGRGRRVSACFMYQQCYHVSAMFLTCS